jgi:hypothetical protein
MDSGVMFFRNEDFRADDPHYVSSPSTPAQRKSSALHPIAFNTWKDNCYSICEAAVLLTDLIDTSVYSVINL